MNNEQRQEAVFGSFDGVVSVLGFIFGLLVHHAPLNDIAIGGLGGAIAAAVSMGAGEIEKGDGIVKRLPVGGVMFLAALIGSLIPVLPFFFFDKATAIICAALGCFAVASWIGYEKHKGINGYVTAYITLLLAAGLTLGIISLIPQSGG